MCLDLYVHWVSRSMHLTELKQSDWVISAWIINEYNKCGKGLEIIVAWLPFKHERMLLLVWVIFSQHDLERNWVLPKLPSDFSFKLRIDQGRKHIKAENICSEKIRSLFSCLLSLPAALATDAQTHNGWATDAQIDESGFTKFVLLKPWSHISAKSPPLPKNPGVERNHLVWNA